MSSELLLELVLVQVRFQAEYFSGNLLIFSFNPLQLLLPLVEMQTLRSELDMLDGVALA